jgi:hypothetical protein
MTDSNNDIVDPSDIQKSEWADKDMDVDSGDPNDIWTDTDGSFSLAVPEPGTMMLFGLGLLGFAGVGRRKIRA